MLSAPFSRLNISFTCTECTSLLRPYHQDTPSYLLPPGLFPDFAFSLPTTPPSKPKLTLATTPPPSTRLRPIAPSLAPSPQFLLTRPTPPKPTASARVALSSIGELPLSPTRNALVDERVKTVTFSSRRLLIGLSSPVDEARTPLSAKTPGLVLCSSATYTAKVIPGFGRAVCRMCEEELRDAVMGLLEEEPQAGATAAKESKTASAVIKSALTQHEELEEFETEGQEKKGEDEQEVKLFAIPSTPPSYQRKLVNSRNATPCSITETVEHKEPENETPLFALPNVALDTEAYEEVTPTMKYAVDFPALPIILDGVSAITSRAAGVKATNTWSENGRKRNSKQM